MGLRTYIDGFEISHSVGYSQGLRVWDVQKARSGHGYFKFLNQGSSGISADLRPSYLSGAAVENITVGNKGRFVTRFFMRAIDRPAIDMEICSIETGSFNSNGLVLKSNGTFACFSSILAGPTEGTASTMVMQEVSGNDFDKWYRFELSVTVTGQAGDDLYEISCTITDPDDNDETITFSITKNGGLAMSSPSWLRATAYAGNSALELDLDDIFAINATNADFASAVLPSADRVASFYPTGQGGAAGWTGHWSDAGQDSSSGGGQTAASAGLQTTFSHESGVPIGMTSIGAIGLVATIITTTSTPSKFIFNGAVVSGFQNTTSAGPTIATEGTIYTALGTVDVEDFASMEFGVESNHATSNALRAFGVNVLYSGNAHSLRERSTGGYRHKVIEWTGAGSTNIRQLTGLGFSPHVVLVVELQSGGGQGVCCKTADHPQNMSTTATGATSLTNFHSLDDDGFTVKGAAFDVTSNRYVAFCFRDDGDGEAGRILLHGSWSKNNLSLAKSNFFGYGVDIAPSFLVLSHGPVYFKTTLMGANESLPLSGAGATLTDGITAFLSNGFTLGTATGLVSTQDARVFWGLSIISPEIETGLAVGVIAPSDPNVQVVLPSGFDVYMVWAKGTGSNQATKRLDEAEYVGALDSVWNNSAPTAVAGIIELTAAAGTFTIAGGTASGKHLDASPAVTCYWVAFSLEAEVPPPAEVIFTDEEGPVGLT